MDRINESSNKNINCPATNTTQRLKDTFSKINKINQFSSLMKRTLKLKAF